MTWFGWFLIGFWALGWTVAAAQVGKPREPLTNRTMGILFLVYVWLATLVVLVGTGNGYGS